MIYTRPYVTSSLTASAVSSLFFFFQAEDGIRDVAVTGVQTCALPILRWQGASLRARRFPEFDHRRRARDCQIGRASCRGRGEISVGAVSLKKKKTIASSGAKGERAGLSE